MIHGLDKEQYFMEDTRDFELLLIEKVTTLEKDVADIKDIVKVLYEDNKKKDETIKKLREYNAKCK